MVQESVWILTNRVAMTPQMLIISKHFFTLVFCLLLITDDHAFKHVLAKLSKSSKLISTQLMGIGQSLLFVHMFDLGCSLDDSSERPAVIIAFHRKCTGGKHLP